MRIPPIAWAAGWLAAQRGLTTWAGGARPSAGGTIVGGALIAVGVLTTAEAARELRQHDTTVNPLRPDESTTLITTGIYQRSRNPIYLGMMFVLTGTAMLSGRKRNLATIPAAMLALNPQIDLEEMALIERFGVDFIEYQQKVPRWM